MWTRRWGFKVGAYACLAIIVLLKCITLSTVNAQCAGITEEITSNGTVLSPNYPGNYPVGSSCSWRLIATESTKGIITITFHFFDLGSNINNFGLVILYDGFNDTSGSSIVELAGSPPVPFSYSSFQQYMFVQFEGRASYPGFNASFISTALGCSSTSRPRSSEANGTLISPNYPSNYHNDGDCQWILYATSSTGVVMLTFHSFNTENCCDFVNIYDGDSIGAPLIATLNGSLAVPFVIAGTQRWMFIQFSTDANGINSGFTADMVSTSFGCTPTSRPRHMEANGTLISPNYPSNYHNDGDCQWILYATSSTGVVMLTFHSFNTESCCDLVNIYDGDSIDAPLIATLNGSVAVPFVIAGTQREMFIQFSTDSNGINSGFTADMVSTSLGCTPTTRPQSLVGSGVISSPNYPTDYHNDGDCQWLLTADDSDGLVEITFSNFTTDSCCDKVFIYDGNNESSQLIASFSGTPETPLVYSTSQQYMLVRFETDITTTASGFSATFRTLNRGCLSAYRPRRLTGSGSLRSPDYPSDYPNNQDCQWLMSSAGEEGEVTLTINSFSTELTNDYLELYDGTNTSSPLLATLSGSFSTPRIYLTRSPFLFMKFVSDSATTNGGFAATYTSSEINECASSPCQNDATCVDGIRSFYCICPPSFTGTFCDTDTNECESSPCRNGASCIDGVNEYTCNCLPGFTGTRCDSGIDECESSPCVNGGTCIDRINGFLCVCPPEWGGVRCNNDTDNCISSPCLNGATCIVEVNGFRCQCSSGYTGSRCESGDPCSPDTRPLQLMDSGSLTSWNYPSSYENNADCQWLLTSSHADWFVELNFDDFSTETCCDVVSVYDGPTTKNELINSFSGELTPPPKGLITTQRFMFVRFIADESISDSGFRATFTSLNPIPAGDPCSPETRPLQLTGRGSFTSANFPSNYDNSADCQWLLVSSDVSQLVQLDFEVLSTELCCDIVKIYDGNTTKSSLIASLSGDQTSPPKGLRTTQRYMFVRFQPDESDNAGGFRATFTSIIAA